MTPPVGPSLLTPSERRTQTSSLLARVTACTDPVGRRRLLVGVALLNLPAADAIAHRYGRRHPAVDQLDLVDCARQALLQAVTDDRPRPGDDGADLLERVVPVVRRAVRDHVRTLGLPSFSMPYADAAAAPPDAETPGETVVTFGLLELAKELGLHRDQLATLSAITPDPTSGAEESDRTGEPTRGAWRAVLSPREPEGSDATAAALRMARELPIEAKWVLCLHLAQELSTSTDSRGLLPPHRLSSFAERVLALLAGGTPGPEPSDVA